MLHPALALAAVCALFQAGPAATQQPTLVVDVHPGAASSTYPGAAPWPHPSGRFGLVRLDDGVHGEELWRIDGTPAGTRLWLDFVPGAGSLPISPVMVGEDVWLSVHGNRPQLWRTDQDAAPPTLVLDGAQFGIQEFGGFAIGLGDRVLLFNRTSPQAPWELWSVAADGSHVPLWTDPGPVFQRDSPYFVDATATAALFMDPDSGLVLTDGTPAGTRSAGGPGSGLRGELAGGFVIQEPVTLPGPVPATRLAVVGSAAAAVSVIFPSRVVWSRGVGERLWVLVDDRDFLAIDSTGSATPLASFPPASNPNYPSNLVGSAWLDGALVFLTGDESLWRSDGTAAGTVRVLDLASPATRVLQIGSVVQAAGRMIFWATTFAQGSEPWSTDGTAAGTFPLGDLEPGQGSSQPAPFALWLAADAPFLAIQTSAHGTEPWYCDGTPQGTRLAADIQPGPIGSLDSLLFGMTCGDRALFFADDGIHGVEPWSAPLAAYQAPHAHLQCRHGLRFELQGWPRLGGRVVAALRGLAPSDRGVALAGAPAATTPLLVQGCGVYVDAATAVNLGTIAPDATGNWSRAVPVPNQPALLGVQVEFQAAMLDATSPLGWRPSLPWRAHLGR